jgi:CHAD domain-containing protein
MSITGMYMLNTEEYDQEKISQALDMLYIDRKNEFRELSEVLLNEKALSVMANWKEFVLNFSLDVDDAFKTWSGQNSPLVSSPQKALTILRQLGHDKTSMNQLVHLLNISYTISLEFKEIYRRLK